MHTARLLLLACAPLVAATAGWRGTQRTSHAAERVAINDNRAPAGTLDAGVLTVHLEAREGDWHPDADDAPGITVRAFAERGKPASVPGPLLRVPEGTEIHAFVTNTLPDTLVVRGLSTRGVASDDALHVPPGDTREARFPAGAPGTYYYTGAAGAHPANAPTRDAELSGAFVVDPRGTPRGARDRVLVIAMWGAAPLQGGVVSRNDLLRFTINGKSWPHTERLDYAVGDTVRFRVVNTSVAVHPMHLHGFFFDVASRGDGATDSIYATEPARVVTERLVPGHTFAMTWVPVRAGNWLFHCHDNFHVLRNAPLDGTPLPAEQLVHAHNHALEMMGGLIMGIRVRGPDATLGDASSDAGRRALRLVARVDSGGTEQDPAYGYVLEEGRTSIPTSGPLLPGPTIVLERGKPVRITVVNRTPEATAVHWHGIELESYYDGVAGFSGAGARLTPAIAPGDSFVVRFTPPRSGTFMYHPHADETRQQQAGLTGAIVVVDSLGAYDPAHDRVLLLTVPRSTADGNRVLVNGRLAPDTMRMRVGERYRLRFADIHTYRPSMIVRLQRDSTLRAWRAVAKDGMDLPRDRATIRRAMQQMGNGETYDFELTPAEAGPLRLTVKAAAGAMLAEVPILVSE
jgi:FtsP/CotA-like multicopper oxidase with cupredoxin domain